VLVSCFRSFHLTSLHSLRSPSTLSLWSHASTTSRLSVQALKASQTSHRYQPKVQLSLAQLNQLSISFGQLVPSTSSCLQSLQSLLRARSSTSSIVSSWKTRTISGLSRAPWMQTMARRSPSLGLLAAQSAATTSVLPSGLTCRDRPPLRKLSQRSCLTGELENLFSRVALTLYWTDGAVFSTPISTVSTKELAYEIPSSTTDVFSCSKVSTSPVLNRHAQKWFIT